MWAGMFCPSCMAHRVRSPSLRREAPASWSLAWVFLFWLNVSELICNLSMGAVGGTEGGCPSVDCKEAQCKVGFDWSALMRGPNGDHLEWDEWWSRGYLWRRRTPRWRRAVWRKTFRSSVWPAEPSAMVRQRGRWANMRAFFDLFGISADGDRKRRQKMEAITWKEDVLAPFRWLSFSGKPMDRLSTRIFSYLGLLETFLCFWNLFLLHRERFSEADL